MKNYNRSIFWAGVTMVCSLLSIGIVYAAPYDRTITNPDGSTEVWTYDDILGVPKIHNKLSTVDGKSESWTYDANGNLKTHTDAEGRVTWYDYDLTNNQKTMMVEAYGTADARTTEYDYFSPDIDVVALMTEPSVAGSGFYKETEYKYSTDGKLNLEYIEVRGYRPGDGVNPPTPISRRTSFTYNDIGEILTIDGPRTDISDVTTYQYYDCDVDPYIVYDDPYACGMLEIIYYPDGDWERYSNYDEGGNAGRKSQRGDTGTSWINTYYTYDNRQRLKTASIGDGWNNAVTTFFYDPIGQIDYIEMPEGDALDYEFDDSHYLRSVTDSLGNKIEYDYDFWGHRTDTRYKDPDGTLRRDMEDIYNHRRHLTSTRSGDSITTYLRDAVGNIDWLDDPDLTNPNTDHNHDVFNRLDDVIDARNGFTDYEYDVHHNLESVTAPNGAVTSYVYDDLGNLLSEQSPDRGNLVYTHDEAGNVLTITDDRSVVVTYTYDERNRPLTTAYSDNKNENTYNYIDGRLKYIVNMETSGYNARTITTGYSYDERDNLTNNSLYIDNVGGIECTYPGCPIVGTEIQVHASVDYDKADKVKSSNIPASFLGVVDNVITNYNRDSSGRIQDITVSYGDSYPKQTRVLTENRVYRADGLLTDEDLSNGIHEDREYDIQGQLDTHTISGTTVNEFYDYDFDLNGNLDYLEQNTTERILDAVYDELDRLTGFDETLNGVVQDALGYSYDQNGVDLNGNRAERTEGAVVDTYTYHPNSNRLNTINLDTVSYDPKGNITALGDYTFTYEGDGRVATVEENGVEVAVYDYDAQGRRVLKKTVDGYKIFNYDVFTRLVGEYDVEGNLKTAYIYDDGIVPIAVWKPENARTTTLNTISSDQSWQTYSFDRNITNPVVLAGPPTVNDGEPGVVQIDDVTSTSASLQFSEFNYQDGVHAQEDISFVVFPEGNYPQDDGTTWQVGSKNINGHRKFRKVTFPVPFANPPKVWVHLQTANAADVATLRIKDVTTTYFRVAIYEQENKRFTGHSTETIGYVAVDMGSPQVTSGSANIGGVNLEYEIDEVTTDENWIGDPTGNYQIRLQEDESRTNEGNGGETDHDPERIDLLYINDQLFTQIGSDNDRDHVTVRRIGTIPWDPDSYGANEWLHVHSDHLQTPLFLTNQVGEKVWEWDRGPFGTGQPNEDPDGDGTLIRFNVRFPGQYYDIETGLHYNWNRYYDPQTGRYITSDPIGLRGGVNTYGYAGQNPLIYIDFNGLKITGVLVQSNVYISNIQLADGYSRYDFGIQDFPPGIILGYERIRVSGGYKSLYHCKETDDCGNLIREGYIDTDFAVNNLLVPKDLPISLTFGNALLKLAGLYSLYLENKAYIDGLIKARAILDGANSMSATMLCRANSNWYSMGPQSHF